MASVRCPGCGAKNPDDTVRCRICGYDLRGHTEIPMSQPKAGSQAMKSGSLKGVLALAVLGVVAIVLAGVLLGVLPGGDVITTARNKVPFLATESSDGWDEFFQPDARLSATMPVDRVERDEPFPWGTTGTLDEWVSTLGPDDDPDTTLGVGWTTVAVPADEKVEASLASLAISWAEASGTTVAGSQESSFQGYPALLVDLQGARNAEGDEVTTRALLIRRREQLVVVSSRSVYADHPQFDRLVNGVNLL